jgi:hypothetical protein
MVKDFNRLTAEGRLETGLQYGERQLVSQSNGFAMNRLLTIFRWPAAYKMDSLKADLLAGLTVALVLIPQSLAYAELAGLPPYYGLYASFLPPLVASNP